MKCTCYLAFTLTVSSNTEQGWLKNQRRGEAVCDDLKVQTNLDIVII